MKIVSYLFACSLVLATFLKVVAQNPEWEIERGPLSTVNNFVLHAVASDGYGQHTVGINTDASNHEHLYYYLRGNNGGVIWSRELTVTDGHPLYSTVTSFGGFVSVVATSDSNKIYLFSSSDGGASWSSPVSFSSSGITMTNLDAFADQLGVHVVWGNSALDEVYYVQFDPTQGQFKATTFRNITDFANGPGKTGSAPRILTSGNKVVVSFVGSDSLASHRSAMTRDGSLSANTWDASPLSASVSDVDFCQQNIGIRGSRIYLIMTQYLGLRHQYRTERDLNSQTWETINDLGTYSDSYQEVNFRRQMIAVGDTMHATSCNGSSASSHIWYYAYMPPNGWPASPFTVDSAASPTPQVMLPTISSSRTGVYVFWANGNSVSIHMRRKVYALSGHITENMFLTDSNWITGDLTIDAGYTVTLKDGSVTIVSDNKKLIVANGGKLLKERGSKVIFGTGATYKITTSLVSNWNMTGIPDSVTNFHKDAVYPNRTVSVVSSFNPSVGYVPTDILSNDRGWWAKFPATPDSVTYEGGYIDSMAMITYSGWNIIGSISSPINTTDVFSDSAGHIAAFYKYNAGYTIVTTLLPGGGYWVQTNTPGRLILALRNKLTAGRGVPTEPYYVSDESPNPFDSYDRFTVTDASGGRQHLFVRNAVLAGTSENIEMPPPAPENAFDVRFSPGQYLQSVTPDSEGINLSIALNSVTYPVELSWNINPGNGLTYTGLAGGGGLGKGSALGKSRSMVIQNRTDGFIHLNVSNRQVQENLPTKFSLRQNYPNPFNPSTVISYDIPVSVYVTLKVYDVLGREVMTLVNGVVEAGYHQTILNATNLASGLYFYQLQAGSYASVKKLVVLK